MGRERGGFPNCGQQQSLGARGYAGSFWTPKLLSKAPLDRPSPHLPWAAVPVVKSVVFPRAGLYSGCIISLSPQTLPSDWPLFYLPPALSHRSEGLPFISNKGTWGGSSLSRHPTQNPHSILGTHQPHVGDALDVGGTVGNASVSLAVEAVTPAVLASRAWASGGRPALPFRLRALPSVLASTRLLCVLSGDTAVPSDATQRLRASSQDAFCLVCRTFKTENRANI